MHHDDDLTANVDPGTPTRPGPGLSAHWSKKRLIVYLPVFVIHKTTDESIG
jgi:hypothetical protein